MHLINAHVRKMTSYVSRARTQSDDYDQAYASRTRTQNDVLCLTRTYAKKTAVIWRHFRLQTCGLST
jgi:hypothetical protein